MDMCIPWLCVDEEGPALELLAGTTRAGTMEPEDWKLDLGGSGAGVWNGVEGAEGVQAGDETKVSGVAIAANAS